MYKEVCSIAYLWGENRKLPFEDLVSLLIIDVKTEEFQYLGPNISKHWKYMDVFTVSHLNGIFQIIRVNCYRFKFENFVFFSIANLRLYILNILWLTKSGERQMHGHVIVKESVQVPILF